ncbi:MAG: response regulator [Reichenbachiella sp.]
MSKKDITVLYVDDEDLNLFLFEKGFENIYNIITAKSGTEGLEKLEEHGTEIIVVISDMRMPKMNGVEFITIAREKYTNIAYFILTAFDYNEEIDEAIQNKIIHKFFTKPFDIKEIEVAIDTALEELELR